MISSSRAQNLDTVPETTRSGSIEVLGELAPGFERILTPPALAFIEKLQRRFGAHREALLKRRREIQNEIDAGVLPDFLPETAEIRAGNWRVAEIPADLRDRRVEITGPVDRKMVINALNSGARVYMADFEDSHSPAWNATIEGQINLRDAVRRQISYVSPEGKRYALHDDAAVLVVRPRGWHLNEKHVYLDSKPVSASLFDFGLYFYHNAQELLRRGTGPYFYLPKLENHLEARLWNEVFVFAQQELGLARGTIKATVLIETILAAFEMDEILYELREHCVGLNCGRWDYIFSFIKKFRCLPGFVLPDRAAVTMDSPFLKAYSDLLIRTCHRRGAHAMGGMAAQIPIKSDPAANDIAIAKVRADKEREVKAGHDGTWVAHPGLVPIALEIFDREMKGPHQIERVTQTGAATLPITQKDLLTPVAGKITEAGLRTNVRVSLLYLESWLSGLGCVPIQHLMEDAATVEISRAQLWQWVRWPEGVLADGRVIGLDLFERILAEESEAVKKQLGELRLRSGKFEIARHLLRDVVYQDDFVEFITLPAYDCLA